MTAIKPRPNQVLKRWKDFSDLASPYIKPIENEADYEAAEALLDEISDRMKSPGDPRYIGLFRLLAENIRIWEEQNVTLPETPPHEVLAHLMQEHQLRQGDLTDLVDQGTLSKILAGKRGVSVRLAKALGERFNVSPSLFL